MARIEHVALWTHDIARLTDFYVQFFGARPGPPYATPRPHSNRASSSSTAAPAWRSCVRVNSSSRTRSPARNATA